MESDKEVIVKCEVCNKDLYKYKCPRCEVHTCSLECVNIHKKELNCNGIRDSSGFVPLSKFDNLNLLSDYRFLEGIDRAINNCRRDPHRWHTRYNNPLPAHLYKLKAAATRRGIRLQYLPQNFTRHQDNKTKLDYLTQEITWKIDFIFPQGDRIKVSEIINEKTRLSSVISKYLDPKQCPDRYKNHLKFYHAAGISEVVGLLKAERRKDPKSVYIMDLSADLKSNLRNRTIIENPIALIVKKAYKDEYSILDDDDNCVDQPVKRNKLGFFGDFTPVTFFNSLNDKSKSNHKNNGDIALDIIHESANLLRGRENDLSDDDGENENYVPSEKRHLDIPMYDKL